MDATPLSDKFAAARNRFLDALSSAKEEVAEHEGFTAYWQTVADEARQSEDLGKLDKWVKDLRRDRDRVQILIEQKQMASRDDAQAAQLIMMLQRILAILDEIFVSIRKRYQELHDRIAWWLLLAPPGQKSKPLPKGIDVKTDITKAGRKDKTVKEQNLAPKPKAPTAIKKKAP